MKDVSTSTNKKIWILLLIMGPVSVFFYLLHVVLGGILWKDYSHITQAVSDLTADGAPDQKLLSIFTTIYGILAIVFSITLFLCWKKKVVTIVRIGLISFIVMEVCSLVGYSMFPLSDGGIEMNFQNIMHIVVTAVVVIATILAMYLTGIGLLHKAEFQKLGTITLCCAVIITLSGFGTGFIAGTGLPIMGLVERINIFTLQFWVVVLSVYALRLKLKL